MSKDRKKPKYDDIAEVEKLVDNIIQKNKEKLEKVYLENIEENKLEDRHPKSNKLLYYIKKDNKKQKRENEALSRKIITQARENLGEEPLEAEVNSEGDPKVDVINDVTHEDKPKKILTKNKKVKSKEKKIKGIQKTDDLIESEVFDEVLFEIERSSKKSNDDQKVVEDKKTDGNKIHEELKAVKNLEEDLNEDSSKKPNEKPLEIIDETKENKDLIDDDSNFLDEQIKKSADTPKAKEKEEIPEKKEPSFKPSFKVQNMPVSKEEQSIVDENIQKNKEQKIESDDFRKIEEKAQKLVKDHVKDENVNVFGSSNKKTDDVIDKKPSISAGEKFNDEHEHVFFDEEELNFDGWSPHLTDKQKKELSMTMGGQTDIERDTIAPVTDIELPKDVLSVDSVKLSDLGFSENEWEELDFYALFEPYAFVEVLKENETLEKCYFLVEMELTEEEHQTLDFITDTIRNINIDTDRFETKGDDDYLAESVDQVIKEYNLDLSEESLNKILYYIAKNALGMGKIDALMRDPNIEDISCDGAGVPLFLYHRTFGSLKSNIQFDTEDDLNSFIHKLAQKCGKHISIAEPMLDATMPDGSRIQMTLSDEITARGSTFTIRKFRSDPFSPLDLVEFNTMSSEMVAYMWIAIENGINMLFAGGTASGKTTSLNALSLFIPAEAKIVSIEETREINLPHPNWIPGVARTGFGAVVANKQIGEIDMYDLMKAALRQRPEYILVGEIRGKEAYVLFQAMATGHATYSTVHADSANSLIHRLEGKPIEIPRVMLQSLDVVSLHVTTRVKNKRARRCKQIIEIIDIDPTTKEILTNEVFRWDPVEDKFVYSGKSYVLERIRAEKDMSRQEMTDEIKKRKQVVDSMNAQNIRDFKDVARLVTRYLDNPDETLKQIDKVKK